LGCRARTPFRHEEATLAVSRDAHQVAVVVAADVAPPVVELEVLARREARQALENGTGAAGIL
jgi:hypothetical protein